MIRSLRGRLLAAVLATQTVSLVLLGVGLYVSLRTSLVRDFDPVLTAKAVEISSLVEQVGPGVKFDFDPHQMPEFGKSVAHPERRPDYFQIWIDDGKTVFRSISLGHGNLLPAAPDVHSEPRDVVLPDGRAGRIIVYSFRLAQDTGHAKAGVGGVAPGAGILPKTGAEPTAAYPQHTAMIAVARDRHQVNTILGHVQWLFLGLGLAGTVASVTAMWLVMDQTLRPVENLAREIARIREEVLDTRVGGAGAPSEFLPVVDKLNDLLARLHAAFARERGFSADVAHELRTPLAALRTEMEVCLARLREPQAYRQTLDRGLAIIERMEHVVQCLLLLTRAENHQLRIHPEAIHLNDLLEECWRQVEPVALERGLRLRRDVEEAMVVNTDVEKVQLVLRNLLENAVTYADTGGQIELSASREGGQIVVRLSNSGSRVGMEDVVHVCDRFWRGDKVRTDAGFHCGLGLAIVQRLTTLLGLSLTITSEQGGWFRVWLRLPAASEALAAT